MVSVDVSAGRRARRRAEPPLRRRFGWADGAVRQWLAAENPIEPTSWERCAVMRRWMCAAAVAVMMVVSFGIAAPGSASAGGPIVVTTMSFPGGWCPRC